MFLDFEMLPSQKDLELSVKLKRKLELRKHQDDKIKSFNKVSIKDFLTKEIMIGISLQVTAMKLLELFII